MRFNALRLKEYGTQHGIDRLTMRKWTSTQDDAWAMAALAVKLCGVQGVYRGPLGPSSYVFMTFGKVQLSKRQNRS
ncbi:MAG: DUF6882 domain-containing protein [Planctomycetales bacterium]